MLKTHLQTLKWAAVLLGFFLGTAASSQLLDFRASTVWKTVGFFVLWLAGFGLADLCLAPNVLSAWLRLSFKSRLIGILACVLAGFFLIFVIPVTVYPKPHTVTITATGEQNPLSKGSEVWLTGIFSGDYDSPNRLKACKGNWSWSGHALVSYKDKQPSTLVCTVRTDDDFTVQIGTHPWSGKVHLEYAGKMYEADLYSDPSNRKQFAFYSRLEGMDRLLWSLFFASLGISLGFTLFSTSIWLVYLRGSKRAIHQKTIPWYGYSVLMILTWSLYLLVYWPGFFSPDTLDQFTQIATNRYTNWHPVFHSLFLWLATRIIFSPTPPVILQILIASSLLGWAFSMFESRGAPRWLMLVCASFLSISPAVGFIILNPWKDVAYSLSISALSLTFLYILDKKNNERISVRLGAALVLIAVCIAMFRHNGPPVALGSLFFMLLVDRKHWKSFLGILLATILIWQVIQGPVYRAILAENQVESQNDPTMMPLSEALFLARFHMMSGTDFLPEQQELLSKLISGEGKPDFVLLDKSSKTVINLAASATMRRPATTLRYFMKKGTFVLQILESPQVNYSFVTFYDGEGMVANPFGFRPDSKFPSLKPFFQKVKTISESPQWNWLFWRNALWMYVLVLSSVLTRFRLNKLSVFAAIVPILLNALPCILICAPRARLIFPTLLLGPVLGIGLLSVQQFHEDPDPAVELEK